MTHDDTLKLLEAYIAGDLDTDRERAVRELLATSDDARQRLRELGDSTAVVAAASATSVPSHVREELMSRIDSTNDMADAPRSSTVPVWALAAAAMIVVMLGAYSWYLNNEVSDLREQLSEMQDVSTLLATPGMRFADLEGVAPNEQAFGKVVVDPERGTAAVYMYQLPPSPEGKQYQLWVMRDGQPTSAGVFTVGADGSALLTLNDLPADGRLPVFSVTIEPTGGEVAPTGMMYLTAP